MVDLKSLDNVYLVIAFIVPGFIIVWTRAQFISGRIGKLNEAALAYLALTTVYYGLTVPFIGYILDLDGGAAKLASWWALIAVGPAAVGMLLGVTAQKGWLRLLGHKLKIKAIHSTPSSWDWRFGTCDDDCFVLVTLTDGSTVGGIFGAKSFSSTDPTERDLYIQEVYDIEPSGAWSERAMVVGILLPQKEIRFVEFYGGPNVGQ